MARPVPAEGTKPWSVAAARNCLKKSLRTLDIRRLFGLAAHWFAILAPAGPAGSAHFATRVCLAAR